MSLLLAGGAQVDLATREGVTPLCSAAQGGNVSCVRLLLQAGANPKHTPANGFTPLDVATHLRRHDVAVLLQARIDEMEREQRAP